MIVNRKEENNFNEMFVNQFELYMALQPDFYTKKKWRFICRVAEGAGLSPFTVRHYLMGTRKLGLERFLDLAQAMSIKVKVK